MISIKRTYHTFLLAAATLLVVVTGDLFAQNNVGIGTSNIHESAILQLRDTTKGTLIPRTDTNAVNAFVASLFPNPGIADGLMIYDVDEETYFYYDGNLSRWVRINRLRGPQGPTGDTGALGPTGFPGRSTHWRDTSGADPVARPTDTCGTYHHDTKRGLIWRFDCLTNTWIGPIARWRMLGYGELVQLRSSSLQYGPMPSGLGDSLFLLPDLTTTIQVPPDTVAHVTVTSQGMVRKRFANDSTFNYVKFDHLFSELGGPLVRQNRSQTVSISPNSFPTPGNPDGQYDKVPWSITSSFTLKGKISPAGNPLPSTDFNTYIIETHGGQLLNAPRLPGTLSDVIIVDGGTGKNGLWENFAVMNVYIIYDRSREAAYPE